jgi:hypothetical protein
MAAARKRALPRGARAAVDETLAETGRTVRATLNALPQGLRVEFLCGAIADLQALLEDEI